MAFGDSGGELSIRSPMPGLIVRVPVQPGQAVAKGDTIVVLESMKMENELKAPRDGTVHMIHVTAGDNVEQNKVLVTISGERGAFGGQAVSSGGRSGQATGFLRVQTMTLLKNRWLWLALDVIWLVGLSLYVGAGTDNVPFTATDHLIYMSRDYHYLVQQRDLDRVLYADCRRSIEQDLRLLSRTVGKMAMGLAWDRPATPSRPQRAWAWGWAGTSTPRCSTSRRMRALRGAPRRQPLSPACGPCSLSRWPRSRITWRPGPEADLCHDARRAMNGRRAMMDDCWFG